MVLPQILNGAKIAVFDYHGQEHKACIGLARNAFLFLLLRLLPLGTALIMIRLLKSANRIETL